MPSKQKLKLFDAEINGIDVTSYRHHPRLLELKFAYFYERCANDFGVNGALDVIEGLCHASKCDIQKIRAVVNRTPEIKKVYTRAQYRHYQEALFLGYLENESRMVAIDRYTGKNRRSMYGKPHFKLEVFVTKEWLDLLDNEPILCGVQTYRNEVERFLDFIARIKSTI